MKEKTSYIPEEIWLEILLRLPIKSLLRFKTVHSSWLSWISSHKFSRTHLQHHARIKYGLLDVENRYTLNSSVSLSVLDCVSQDHANGYDQVDARRVEIQYPFRKIRKIEGLGVEMEYIAEVIGSHNGLLLIAIGTDFDRFILWNPSTREYKTFCRKLPHYPILNMAGFAYQDVNDDYKVILASSYITNIRTLEEIAKVEIYSIRRGGWEKSRHPFPYYLCKTSLPGFTLANGVPHWPIKRMADLTQQVVLFFDLVENKFKEVPLHGDLSNFTWMSTLYGYLCLGVIHIQQLHLWVMKEYGVKESWVKLSLTIPAMSKSPRYSMPVGFARKDQVLMNLGRNALAIYDANKIKFNTVLVPNYRDLKRKVTEYVESLVFPKEE